MNPSSSSISEALETMAREIRLLRQGGSPRLLGLDAAASALEVGERTLRRYIDKGLLRVVRLPSGGGRRDLLRIDIEDLNAFIESRKGKTAPSVTTNAKEPVYSVPKRQASRK